MREDTPEQVTSSHERGRGASNALLWFTTQSACLSYVRKHVSDRPFTLQNLLIFNIVAASEKRGMIQDPE